ncbi:MAG: Uma2 family endonuclease [Dysgonamonadaceae bacterium]|jgi:Uma2 family endonuclease|nr:Uma2 family endonuclease [Dysgonamonadaceae bacterium]
MELILDVSQRYTYADYLTWMDDKLRELLNGFIRLMSPAPNLKHAVVSRKLGTKLINYIDKRKYNCQVFYAPFDVRFPKNPNETADNQIYTVVQPDICIVCDLAKLDERGCLGAPDMVVEILSLSSQRYDLNEKFNIYEAGGVKEYWVVSPKEKGVNVFLLQADGKYDRGTTYEGTSIIPVQTLPELSIDLEQLFKD